MALCGVTLALPVELGPLRLPLGALGTFGPFVGMVLLPGPKKGGKAGSEG